MDLRHAFSQIDAALTMLHEEYGVVTAHYDTFVEAAKKHSVDFDAFDPTIYPLEKIFTLTSLTFILENQFKLHHVLSMFLNHHECWSKGSPQRHIVIDLAVASVTIGHQGLLLFLLRWARETINPNSLKRTLYGDSISDYVGRCIERCLDHTYVDSFMTIIREENCLNVPLAFDKAIELRSRDALAILLEEHTKHVWMLPTEFPTAIGHHIARPQSHKLLLELSQHEWKYHDHVVTIFHRALSSECPILKPEFITDDLIRLVLSFAYHSEQFRIDGMYTILFLFAYTLDPISSCSDEVRLQYLRFAFATVPFVYLQRLAQLCIMHASTIEKYREELVPCISDKLMIKMLPTLHNCEVWNGIFEERNIYGSASYSNKVIIWKNAYRRGEEAGMEAKYELTLDIVINVLGMSTCEGMPPIVAAILRHDLSSVDLDVRKKHLKRLVLDRKTSSKVYLLMGLIQPPHNWKLDIADVIGTVLFPRGAPPGWDAKYLR